MQKQRAVIKRAPAVPSNSCDGTEQEDKPKLFQLQLLWRLWQARKELQLFDFHRL